MVPRFEISLILLVAGSTERTHFSVKLDLSTMFSKLCTRDMRGVGEVGMVISGFINKDAFTGCKVKLIVPKQKFIKKIIDIYYKYQAYIHEQKSD